MPELSLKYEVVAVPTFILVKVGVVWCHGKGSCDIQYTDTEHVE